MRQGRTVPLLPSSLSSHALVQPQQTLHTAHSHSPLTGLSPYTLFFCMSIRLIIHRVPFPHYQTHLVPHSPQYLALRGVKKAPSSISDQARLFFSYSISFLKNLFLMQLSVNCRAVPSLQMFVICHTLPLLSRWRPHCEALADPRGAASCYFDNRLFMWRILQFILPPAVSTEISKISIHPSIQPIHQCLMKLWGYHVRELHWS